jgi:hypothetical protein
MAIGDTVSQASGSAFTFRPASGVQVCLTTFISSRFGSVEGRGNIDTTSHIFKRGAGGGSEEEYISYWVQSSNQKMFLDYNSYLYFIPYSSHYVGFSGIQTQ